jgi:predicted phosphoadenosine phosphosulfate sulfurtransferase
MDKRPLDCTVDVAAQKRITWTFDTFDRICVSFSGGKDSTVMLHLVMEEAMRRKRKVGLLFIDWEAQYRLTIQHVEAMYARYADWIEPYWIALPLTTTNAVSMYEPEWICWEPGKDWVRPLPPLAISDQKALPFYHYAMTFEEFVPAFNQWFAGGELTACFVGIRATESLNRYRTVTHDYKSCLDGKRFTTWQTEGVFNVYPVYDWQTRDIWIYHGKTGMPYNTLYDRMYQAGLSIHQMRICEPYGDEQRKGLWLFQVIEPDTWGKIVSRVNGANAGALYAKERGNILGNALVTRPEGHTWESFAMLLLGSMPDATAEHYRNKIAVWIHWYHKHGREIADELPGDTGSQDMPSWRRVCKMLLKNDYWCKTICFSPQKNASYEKYLKIMKKRRQRWGIF